MFTDRSNDSDRVFNRRSNTYGRPSAPRFKQRKRHVRIGVVAALVAIVGGGVVLRLAADAQNVILKTEHRMIAAEPTVPITISTRLNTRELKQEIESLLEEYPGIRTSVAFYDFGLKQHITIVADESFVAASVPKLLTAALWLHQVDEGERTLQELVGGSPAKELLRSLIEISDNTAWELLDAELGRKALEDYATSIGMRNYDFADNSLSTADTMALLQRLYRGTLLKPESSKLLLGYMEKANYTQYIISVLPEEAKAYHKVGFLEDRVLDAAIVENGRLPYALVIFTEAQGTGFSLPAAGQLLRAVTETVQANYQPRLN